MQAEDGRPLCKYGSACFRKNPQHFKDFAHTLSPVASASASGPAPPPPPPPPPPLRAVKACDAMTAPAVGETHRAKCKFGCGRLVAPGDTKRKRFTTCCRACGLSSGAGDHDEFCTGGAARCSGGASSSSTGAPRDEAEALMAADQALELLRLARECDPSDVAEIRRLMAESAERMSEACLRMPHESHFTDRVEAMAEALKHASRKVATGDICNDVYSNDVTLEEDLDEEIDRLVTRLEEAVTCARGSRTDPVAPPDALPLAVSGAPSSCRLGCGRSTKGRVGSRFYDTCCRTCARTNGGGHDDDCSETTALMTLGATLSLPGQRGHRAASAAGESRHKSTSSGADAGVDPDVRAGKKTDDEKAGPEAGGAVRGFSIQEALRYLGLSDDWPTDLTWKEIRRRYMKEALRCHPDKGPPEEKASRTTRFQDLAAAYATLEAPVATLECLRGGATPPLRSTAPVASTRAAAASAEEVPTAGIGAKLALQAGALALPNGSLMALEGTEDPPSLSSHKQGGPARELRTAEDDRVSGSEAPGVSFGPAEAAHGGTSAPASSAPEASPLLTANGSTLNSAQATAAPTIVEEHTADIALGVMNPNLNYGEAADPKLSTKPSAKPQTCCSCQ